MKVLFLLSLVVAVACFQQDGTNPGWPLVFNQPDTASMVRYEARGLNADSLVLRLYEDRTYRVTAVSDGTTVNTGRWEVDEVGALCMAPEPSRKFDCSIKVYRHWLHDFEETTGHRLWNESPLNDSWPSEEVVHD